MNSPRTKAVRKIQGMFRKKRVFTEVQLGWKMSKSVITSKIVSIKANVDFDNIFNGETPVGGVEEIMGYLGAGQKPIIRYVKGKGWIGSFEDVKRAVVKKGPHTMVLTKDSIDILGNVNYEQSLLICAKNSWISKSVLHTSPTYKKIDGKFNINKDLNLPGLEKELKKLPASILDQVAPYNPELFPALVLKLKKPKWTYQFFDNGTVLFTGIKNPADIETPKELFKQFFSPTYGLNPARCIDIMNVPKTAIPKGQGANAKKLKLAARYELAGVWGRLRAAPNGYYIRPGTNGAPRFYPWKKLEKRESGEMVPVGVMNLKAVAPKVRKAFENAGQSIPEATLAVFRNAGYPLANLETKSVVGLKNRRAPSWNATKPGFYVRPGPGRQPYWFAIPKGIASGRKTAINTYTKAGINIPRAVRNIFKIPNSVIVDALPQHHITMGLDKILRINNRQATRLTKPELLAIARNMNIAQVNAKMDPSRIISFIQRAAGMVPGARAERNYNVKVGNVAYKFRNNGKVERTVGKVRTARNWATLSSNERKNISNALVPANMRQEFNSLPRVNQATALAMFKQQRSPPTPKRAPSAASSASSLGNFAANLEKELEWGSKLTNLMGNYYKNENVQNLIGRINALPSGTRGGPKKTNINRTVKNFVKEKIIARRQNLIRSNFETKIIVPNWLPVNKQNAYRRTMINLMKPNAKGKYPAQKNIKEGMRGWLNSQIPKVARPAYTKENMMTGETIRVPAWNPPKEFKFTVPKRLSPPKPKKKTPVNTGPKKPRPKKDPRFDKKYVVPMSNNVSNLGNAMISANLNIRSAHSWNELARVGINERFKNTWLKHVASN